MNNLLQNLKALGPKRLITLGAVGVAVLLGVALMATMMARPTLGVLYAGLDDVEAGRVIAELDAQKVPYEVAPGGTIQVPEESVARTRMMLAQQGLPAASGAGYELFDGQGALGLTSFMQRMNRLRALEGELSRTIQTLNGVRSARVHLVMPDAEAFARNEGKPSASVVVRTASAGLPREQAIAVRHLVAAAVPGLAVGSVTVMDSNGVVLAADGSAGDGLALLKAEEMRSSTEARLSRSIEEMLAPRFGAENVRVRVAAELDLGKEVVREQTYDPAGRVVRSTQTVEEQERSTDRSVDDPVTVEQNLPLADIDAQAAVGRTETDRAEETTNYEISSVQRERIQDAGSIDRLAVAVMVNGTMVTAADGTQTYQPRTAEELAQVENLVKAAIGFKAERGDQVTVENLQFVTDPGFTDPVVAAPTWLDILQKHALDIVQWVVIGTVMTLLILLVLRPLALSMTPQPVTGVMDEPGMAAGLLAGPAGGTAYPQLADGTVPVGGVPQLTDQSGIGPDGQPLALEAPLDDAMDELMDLRSVEGGVSANALRKLASIVDEHPEESVTVLRSWIYEGSAA